MITQQLFYIIAKASGSLRASFSLATVALRYRVAAVYVLFTRLAIMNDLRHGMIAEAKAAMIANFQLESKAPSPRGI